ncbi:ATPase of 26S proteasome regulatory subunit 4 [Blyttiomyces sp. JEL0837]|nr:ATPase of 26S proteasome regulatory subunit 4 [Blyttiomyces sp. JEL0837]
MTEAELVRRIGDYHIVCMRDDTHEEQYLTDEVIRSAHRLLAIGIFGKHTSCVDLETSQTMGIPVFTSPFQHQGSVAEMVISMIVLLARQVGDRSKEIHKGEWNKVSAGCIEVRGKTLGIVGYGQVGSQLGVMAESLSMRVIFYDTLSLMPIGRAEPKASLEAVLKEADFVALNVSSLPENVNMIGQKELALMKKNSYIINGSYERAIDEEALAAAIKSGHLAGAALDCFPNQPRAKKSTFTSPLAGLKNVIMTPNIGDVTVEAEVRVGTEVANSVYRFISEGSTVGSTNFPSVAAWPLKAGTRRILNMHRNVRGVLQEIDYILSAYNVGKQVLDTREGLGYLIADIATEEVTTEIVSQLALLASTGQNQSSGLPGAGDNKDDQDKKKKQQKKWEPPLPTRVGKKKKKGPDASSKLPPVFPTTRCKLKLLKNERIKDYVLMEEEFVQNQERLKPQEEKNQEERTRVDELRGSPMNVGSLEEIIDDDHAIVSTSSSTEYYVSIMSYVDKDLLEPGCSVLLHHKNLAVIGVLQDDSDPMVSVMKLEKAPTESYADVGGLDQQVQEIKEAVELPLTHPELYEEMGIKPPKGVILYGPPGTGKTLLAKAVANQTSATFLRVVGSELIQKYLGDGPKLVRELFRVAEENAPSIVFIDEIDAVGTKRYDSTSGGEREIQRTMLELLNQLDGFDSRGDVKVIMATNRIDSLDPALIRPGRIDRKIEFPLPDVKTKRRIFNIHTGRMTLGDDVDLEEFVMAKDDLSGADIKAICTEAGLLALRERRMKVVAEDFKKAKEKVLYRKNEGTPEGLYL